MPEPKILAWMDLETTGTSVKEGDEIMEVGCLTTDLELQPLEWELAFTVLPSPAGLDRLEENLFVHEMHERSGLLDMVHSSGESAQRVDKWLYTELMDGHPGLQPGELLLSGSGVSHFDRPFIREYLPMTDGLLNYAALDIGVLRRVMETIAGRPDWVPPIPESSDPEVKAHRALLDAKAHLAEAQAYQALFDRLAALETVHGMTLPW